MDPLSLIVMFWHIVFFEAPRFVISIFAVGGAELLFRTRSYSTDAANSAQKSPTVSLLLAGHNEGTSLEQCITGLHEQTTKPNQIVVIDDGSNDDMTAVASRLKDQGLIDVFVSTGLRGGKSSAANLGLTYCSGDIVIIADIDTSFDRSAITHLIDPFRDAHVGAVSGNIGVRNHQATIIARFQTIQYLVSISLGRRVTDMLGFLFIASGAFAAFRRSALTSIGGWEVGPGEDADLTVKLRQAGWKVRFQPYAWALTDVPETLTSLIKQRLRWNRTLIRVRVRKFRSMFNPFRPTFSLSNALGSLDIIYFQAIIPTSFVIYIAWLAVNYGADSIQILIIVSLGYIFLSLVSFLIAAALSPHYGRLSLFLYVPGYAIFNAYLLRLVGIYSYIDELLMRNSYKDTYVPSRVLNNVEKF